MTTESAPSRLDKWNPPAGVESAARAGVKQTTSIRLVSLVVQFASAALLARLLGPTAFGVVAVATLITGFATIFNDMGVGSAIVQRPILDEDTITSAFWLNAGVGFLLSAIVSASTPLWISFFHQPQLSYMLPLASLTLVLSVSLVQRSLLQRAMRFKAVMGLDLLYGVLSAAVSVVLVVFGVGVVAIPIGAIVATAISSVVAFALCPCWPAGTPSMSAIRKLWNYSASVLGFNIINYVGKNLDNVIVGRSIGTAALGFYSRAYNLMQLPVVNLSRVMGTVLFPALASTRGATHQFRHAWTVSSRASLVIGVWVAAVTATCSFDLVPVIYGGQWNPMASSLAVLMLGVPAFIIASNASAVFLALGATKMQFRLGLISLALRVIGIVIGVQSGYFGVAVAVAITGYVTASMNVIAATRLARIRLITFTGAISIIVLAGAAATVGGFALNSLLRDANDFAALVAIATAVTVVYVVLLVVFDREALSSFRARVGKPRSATHQGQHRSL